MVLEPGHDSATVTTLTVMQALEFMAAAYPVVPLGLLHMRCLERWFASPHLDARKHLIAVPAVSPECKTMSAIVSPRNIFWRGHCWTCDLVCLSVHGCVPVRVRSTCLGRAIGCVWPSTESQHINLLQLQAVFPVLQHFKPQI